MVTGKKQILKAIDELPEDAKAEDALEKIILLMKIQKGLEQANSGQLVTQEEARKRMANWVK